MKPLVDWTLPALVLGGVAVGALVGALVLVLAFAAEL